MSTPSTPPRTPSATANWLWLVGISILCFAIGAAWLMGLGRMLPIRYTTQVVLLGTTLLGACAGTVGSFAVLRGQALVGDALAHAALPGLCVAFLLVGQRSLPALLTGAFVAGILGVVIISALRRSPRVKDDAAIGIVLSVLFGLGIVLDRLIQNRTTTGSKAGLDSYILGKTAGMIAEDVYLISGVTLFCFVIVLVLYKEFKLVSFDAGFAASLGWPSLVLDLSLMVLVAAVVVLGLPAVGVVMMAALLILPGAAARFWTDQLSRMLVLSALFGVTTGAVGTAMSARYSGMPAGPIIVLVGATLFLVSVLLAPRRGAVARLLVQHSFRRKTQQQKMLLALLDLSERHADGRVPFDELLRHKSWTAPRAQRLLRSLRSQGLVTLDGPAYRLTETGGRRATDMARAHRLLELFLTEHPQVAGSLVDLDLESIEQTLPPEILRDLQSKLAARADRPRLAESGGDR